MAFQQRQFGKAPVGGAGFNRYAAGKKSYGMGQRPNPNQGKVDNAQAAAGYNTRDRAAEARKKALLRRAGGL